MLDHPQNDIFIHMDAKNKSYNPSETLKLIKYSNVFHTRRIKVAWGGYSLIEAELILLEASTSKRSYEHYHLLSGADLPIKRQEDIITFFEGNHGTEFLSFQKGDDFPTSYKERVKFHYIFQEIIGKTERKNIMRRVLKKIQKFLVLFQKLLHVHRNKGIDVLKGSQWFSISDEFARYVLTQKEWIRKVFRNTFCCDEIFMHTLLMNSEFRNNLKNSMRFIDWKRGGPYVFRIDDLEAIKQSEAMFARKFDEKVDSEIIREIQKLYS